MPLAVFRCDASPTIGAGHVSRCLALAEALTDAGWRVRFVVGPETVAITPNVASYDPHVLPAAEDDVQAIQSEAGEAADLIVVDHYGRDAAFEAACRPFAHTILAFDDMTGRDHDCDIILDAAAKGPEQYRRHVPEGCQVLAGPAYAIVRKAFIAARPAALARHDGRAVLNILVSCGATDPFNVTATVLDALADLPADVRVTAVLSSKAAHLDTVRRNLRPQMTLVTDAGNMAELMTQADLAIGAPGTTSYERAVLGLPSILVTLADNQRGIAATMTEAGAAVDAGDNDAGLAQRVRRLANSLLQDATARARLSSAASRLVDGRGAIRVLLACVEPIAAKDGVRVQLRSAGVQDEAWLLELQRQPSTRRFYRNPAVPSREEHHEWLKRTLDDPMKLLFVIESGGEPVGTLRLDQLSGDNEAILYEVSIAVDAAHANRGIGSAALGLIRRLMPAAQFEADIAPENIASQRAFAHAGYQPLGGRRYRTMASLSGNR